jgi:hypothetical protein
MIQGDTGVPGVPRILQRGRASNRISANTQLFTGECFER